MALTLSTLTSPSNNSVLEEINTTADFLEGVPLLKNAARGSQAGGSAKQDVALNQPRALPLIKNPQGKLGGYLYIPNASGNYATGPGVTIGANQTWEAEVDIVITQFGDYVRPLGGGDWDTGFGLFISATQIIIFCKGASGVNGNILGITLGKPFNLKYGFDGTYLYAEVDGTRANITQPSNQSSAIYRILELNQQTLNHIGNYAIQKAKLTVNNAVVFDCDFNGSTSIRHGDTKFQASVGGPVSLIKAGQDPVTVVKKNILRFDGVNDGLRGLFANNINGGYMFAAFSVLGDGGEAYGRVFGANISGGFDYQNTGFALRRLDSTETLNLRYSGGSADTHQNLFDDDRGDLLLESRVAPSSQKSKVNDADLNNGVTTIPDTGVAATRYSISSNSTGASNLAIDLEFLALFSADSVPDEATAKRIRDYINGRGVHPIFSLIDSAGYYFYDATRAPSGPISSGSSAWSGRIVGSDNGDADKLATQSTANHQPVSDGFKVTFADNTDHLDIPSTSQAGWQIVGTSLGCFMYRVNANAQVRLNLLGYRGNASYRKAGDLYGVMLLPESASSSDIESARKLLIDRGSLDGSLSASYFAAWIGRNDIVEFKSVDLSSATSVESAWQSCGSLTTFPALNLSGATNVAYAWFLDSSLDNFGAIDARNASIFLNTWRGCTALTSFPAGAKLGTSASNVNFSSAWKSSGLTSFPALELNNGNNFVLAFDACSNLTSLETGISFSANASNIAFYGAFLNCTSLVDFPPRAFDGFGTPANDSFLNTWLGCSALSANSVENILVSIDTSGQSAPSSGPQITISYNVSTGSLSAATNTAVTSLKSKGWSIIVNNVTL